MAKQKFANLNRGQDKIENALSSFVINKNDNQEEKPSFNPLKDKRPRKQETQQQKEQVKESQPTQKLKKVAAQKNESKEKAKPVTVQAGISFADDFKAHSAIFSHQQLSDLRNVVNYRKWKENPKYSIKMAIYEAVEMLLGGRVAKQSFPDDFVTYSPLFSVDQWNRLNSFIGEIRFKDNDKYAIKYALYEAIEMFLKANPVD